MNCVRFVFCLYVLICIHLINGKESCIVTDIECVTKEAQKAFNIFVPGIKGLIEPSDPLFLENVEAFLPNLPYILSNLTLTGIKHCQVTQFRINEKDLTYQYDLQCPRLVLNYHHKAKGLLDTVEIDTDGLATITLDDYIIKINGGYTKIISKVDQKLHLYLKDFTMETEPKGTVTCNIHSQLHSDKSKADLAINYINEHSKDIEKILKAPTMEKFIKMFLENLDFYLTNYFFEVQFPETNTD